jgi:flagellar biogenesis protein FliO
MIYFATIEHIEIMGEKKDLVHIVKVSNDTFAQSEIIPIFGIMLCVLGLIFY